MKRSLLILWIAGLLLASTATYALAKAPVGTNSGASSQSAGAQYEEDVPTAAGSTPTSSLHGGTSSSSIPSSTLSRLRSSQSGAAAADLAESLAPTEVRTATPPTTSIASHRRASTPRTPTGTRPSSRTHDASAPTPGTTPAAIEAAKTITGDTGGGIGILLPIILIILLILASGAGIVRLRRSR